MEALGSQTKLIKALKSQTQHKNNCFSVKAKFKLFFFPSNKSAPKCETFGRVTAGKETFPIVRPSDRLILSHILVLKSVKRQFEITQSFLSLYLKALKLWNFLSGSSFCYWKSRQVLNFRWWQYLSFGSRFRGSIDTAASLLRLLSRPKQNARLWLWLKDIRKKSQSRRKQTAEAEILKKA